jgi:hypothetical protein
MQVDGNIGGSIDGTGGADLADISKQVAVAERVGYDGVWTSEVSRDPFLSLLLAADRSQGLRLGTAVAVAFTRNLFSDNSANVSWLRSPRSRGVGILAAVRSCTATSLDRSGSRRASAAGCPPNVYGDPVRDAI